ncbi:protein kinase domain-containing protein [Luteolibacter soli]|uniref:Protein kinase n=1 Tax=Luteolibacter soli TaxID=3135280 RepID=A0ABU9AY63_9BACT
MTESHSCPDCGAPLPADSPQSLCPACLLRQALASRTIVAGQESTPPPPPPTPEEIADKFPQFEVTECLGSGGMGVVYKARQKSLDRWVAIKILRPEKTGDERFAERFAREAQTLARLNQPNIVTVFDYGETDGLFYIVMEFVDGVNLRDLLREGRLEPEQALAIVPPICEALQYAHAKGIVHRDIKPENLLLDRDGRLKIADFGIASLVGATGETSGTPPYMAPEQKGPSKVDHRADIYALGVVLYEMLTGERPAKELVAPSRKVQVDVRLDEMVLRALDQNPERRYQTAEEFRTVVETIQPEPAPPPFPPADSPAPVKAPGMWRRYWWLIPLMIPIGILIGLCAGILQSSLTPKRYVSQTVIQVVSSEDPLNPTPAGALPVKLGLITSPLSLEEVASRLNLRQRWGGDPEMMEYRLREMIEVQPITGTSLVAIRVTDTDPTEAAEIANSLAQVFLTKSKGLIHETAIAAKTPIQPVVLLILVKSSLVGVLVALIAAVPLMLLAHRRSLRKNGIPTRSRGLKICASILLCLLALFFAKQRIFPTRLVRGDEGPFLGRVKFEFHHPEAVSGGFSIGFPVRQDETSPFRPGLGQRETLKDGHTGWMRARVVSHGPASPVVVAATSLDGEHWEAKEAVLDSWPTGSKLNLEFANGYKAQVSWDRGAEGPPAATQGPRWLVVIPVVLLLVLVGLVLLIIAIAKTKSGTAKVVGIIVVILLILGIFVAVPLMWMVTYRAHEGPLPIPVQQGMKPSGEIELLPEGN